MSENNKSFTVGISLTIVWIVGFFVISGITINGILDGRFDSFYKLDLNAKGDFLAGLFAPVAFLWLIIGSFQQQQEIAMQREELKLQREELQKNTVANERQAESIQANTNHAAMQTFLMLEKSLVEGLKWSLKKFITNYKADNVNVLWDNGKIVKAEKIILCDNLFIIIRTVIETLRHKAFQHDILGYEVDNVSSYISKAEKRFYDSCKNPTDEQDKLLLEAVESYSLTFEKLMCGAEDIAALTYDNRIHDFHYNSPAGELYRLFQKIIKNVEKHNEAQAAQQNNQS